MIAKKVVIYHDRNTLCYRLDYTFEVVEEPIKDFTTVYDADTTQLCRQCKKFYSKLNACIQL